MEEILRELEASPTLRSFLAGRIPVADGPGCFCCRLIWEDLERHGKLTGYPFDFVGSGTYPVTGKVLHLAVELKVEMMLDGKRARHVRDLLPEIHDRVEELHGKGEPR